MPLSPSSSAQAVREAVARRLRDLRREAALTVVGIIPAADLLRAQWPRETFHLAFGQGWPDRRQGGPASWSGMPRVATDRRW